jgi:hypothetical protein
MRIYKCGLLWIFRSSRGGDEKVLCVWDSFLLVLVVGVDFLKVLENWEKSKRKGEVL